MSKLHYIRKGTGQNKILLIHGNVALRQVVGAGHGPAAKQV